VRALKGNRMATTTDYRQCLSCFEKFHCGKSYAIAAVVIVMFFSLRYIIKTSYVHQLMSPELENWLEKTYVLTFFIKSLAVAREGRPYADV